MVSACVSQVLPTDVSTSAYCSTLFDEPVLISHIPNSIFSEASVPCNFESQNMCGYQIVVPPQRTHAFSGIYSWIRKTGKSDPGPDVDNSYGIVGGTPGKLYCKIQYRHLIPAPVDWTSVSAWLYKNIENISKK